MSPVTAAAALVGRDSELALLDGLLREAARGRGGAVLIEGEPGIGKSTLVHAAVAAAPEAGCQVFWGVGDELSTALPLLPFLDALRVREPSVNTTAEDDRRIAARRNRRRPGRGRARRPGRAAARAGRRGVRRAAVGHRRRRLAVGRSRQRHPVGTAREDGQYLPLLLIGTARPVPQRDDLLALRRVVSDAGRLRLDGLTDPAVADLIAALSGGRPDDGLLRLAEGAAGNPLYLTELVAALVRGSA